VTSIERNSFYYCTALTSITIPSSVTSIGEYALYYCVKLANIYYRGTEAQWNAIAKEGYLYLGWPVQTVVVVEYDYVD
jgi:hypothetical protein